MRKSLCIAIVPLTLLASPALAQSVTGTVDITGSVAGRCLFTIPNEVIDLGELSLSGTDGNAGKLNTAVVNGRNATLVGWCNSASASMEVEATKLTNTASIANGFTNTIDYLATATANQVDATDTTTVAGAGTPANVGMFTGSVLVTLSNAATDGSLLVAGDYSGEVVVTLKPNFTPPQ